MLFRIGLQRSSRPLAAASSPIPDRRRRLSGKSRSQPRSGNLQTLPARNDVTTQGLAPAKILCLTWGTFFYGDQIDRNRGREVARKTMLKICFDLERADVCKRKSNSLQCEF